MAFSDILNVMQNSIGGQYITALVVFAAIILALKLFKIYIINFLKKASKKTKTDVDDMVIEFIDSIKWPFYVYVSFYISAKLLLLPEILNKGLYYLLVFLIVLYAVKGLMKVIDYISEKEIKKRKENNISMIMVLANIAKFIIIIIAFLMVLSNLGVQITPLIAGLGVGGIAIALALQVVLSDLFSAFAIYFDKPFQEGDFIIVGTDMGVVKHIGIKTTRISTLQGQELVISNSELTSTRINNYKKMEKRRIAFNFGVEYSTNTAKLKKINPIIKDIFKKVNLADLDRVHFKEFGDSSLVYEVVYYLKTGDYNKYMDVQQEINFAIKEQFEKEKISMAFPSTTVYLKKS